MTLHCLHMCRVYADSKLAKTMQTSGKVYAGSKHAKTRHLASCGVPLFLPWEAGQCMVIRS